MNIPHLFFVAKQALAIAIAVTMISLATFLIFEPTLSSAITDDFTVTQQITNEIAFVVAANDVTMVGSIAGITGGYATGTTQTVVRTNNPTGYKMTLHFATTSSGHAMIASSTAYINNYTPASPGTADYFWQDNPAGASAEFGYTVANATTGEVGQAFKSDGSTCGTSTLETADRCWMNPSTTPQVIVNSVAPNNGSTTTIKFKVAVPNSPSPALPAAYYVATGTLTATNNP